MSTNQKRHDTFLEGRLVYLRLPDIEKDVRNGEWHHWFNDYNVTQELVHGVFPVSREMEEVIISDEIKRKDSLILSIIEKETHRHIGVISLKSIDMVSRTAEIGMVFGFHRIPNAALEAIALLTEHAFNRLNLAKVYAGQFENLWRWVVSLTMIGYRIEGFREAMGQRDGKRRGVVLTGITDEQFYALTAKRNGKLMPEDLSLLSTHKPTGNQLDELRNLLDGFNRKFDLPF